VVHQGWRRGRARRRVARAFAVAGSNKPDKRCSSTVTTPKKPTQAPKPFEVRELVNPMASD
jgi:hypothetical protein